MDSLVLLGLDADYASDGTYYAKGLHLFQSNVVELLPSGLYVLELLTDEGITFTKIQVNTN